MFKYYRITIVLAINVFGPPARPNPQKVLCHLTEAESTGSGGLISEWGLQLYFLGTKTPLLRHQELNDECRMH